MNEVIESLKTLRKSWIDSNRPKYFSKFYFKLYSVIEKTVLRNRNLHDYYFWLKMDGNTNEISIKRYNAQKNDKKRLYKRLKLLDINSNECMIRSIGTPNHNNKWFECIHKKINIEY